MFPLGYHDMTKMIVALILFFSYDLNYIEDFQIFVDKILSSPCISSYFLLLLRTSPIFYH